MTFDIHVNMNLSFINRNEIYRKAQNRLEEIVEDYLIKENARRKKRKILRDSCDLVCIHVRRTDRIKFDRERGKHELTEVSRLDYIYS